LTAICLDCHAKVVPFRASAYILLLLGGVGGSRLTPVQFGAAMTKAELILPSLCPRFESDISLKHGFHVRCLVSLRGTSLPAFHTHRIGLVQSVPRLTPPLGLLRHSQLLAFPSSGCSPSPYERVETPRSPAQAGQPAVTTTSPHGSGVTGRSGDLVLDINSPSFALW